MRKTHLVGERVRRARLGSRLGARRGVGAAGGVDGRACRWRPRRTRAWRPRPPTRRSSAASTMPCPTGCATLYSSLRRFLDQSGFPPVFGDLPSAHDRRRPAAGIPAPRAVPRCRPRSQSVLKIYGAGAACGRGIEGTGFVYAPHRVLTNAHVVAGTDQVRCSQRRPDRCRPPSCCSTRRRDVAVLDVPDLAARPAARSPDATRADGRPRARAGLSGERRRSTCGPARVRGRDDGRRPDIYGNGVVEREIYAIRVARAQRQLRRPAAGDRRDGARHGVRDGARLVGHRLRAHRRRDRVGRRAAGRRRRRAGRTGSCTPD